ncbi:MAG: hypothetical protein ACRDKY_09250 [Solirubrobacteraceae bacterium]
MEILVAILVIALLVAVGFAVMQRRPGGAPVLGRRRTSPLPPRDRGAARRDPMAGVVAEHAQAMDPQDVVAAEQRMRAQARRVAAGLHAEEARSAPQADTTGYGEPAPAPAPAPAYDDPRWDEGSVDPATRAPADDYDDPATDPRYNDRRYDGRLAADWVDPQHDDRRR